MNFTPIILCGGFGQRIWPLSRESYPKQFINLINDKSLFQQTIERVISVQNDNNIIDEILFVANEKHRFLLLEQIEQLKINIPYRIILEPISKNTAAALTIASLVAIDKNPKTITLVLPSDHYIKNNLKFAHLVRKAFLKLQENSIFLLGIKPDSAKTCFGYIEYEGKSFFKSIIKFTEKPILSRAKSMIKRGNHAWNSGIFILKPNIWLTSIRKSNFKIFDMVSKSFKKISSDYWFLRPDSTFYSRTPSDSIDYAVIEKKHTLNLNLKMSILDAGWSDLGSFNSLYAIDKKDENGNVLKGDIVSINSTNNYIFSDNKNISVLGIKDLVVIDTEDCILITDRNYSDDIKKIINILQKNHYHLLDEHIKVNRPWGYYKTMDYGENFKVKKIVVKPKAKLSYQSHNFRNEHWVVVQGKATIIYDDKSFILRKNESTYIKKKLKHQLINNEKHYLEIIEVQLGTKVDEDDIKRYSDIYGRS